MQPDADQLQRHLLHVIRLLLREIGAHPRTLNAIQLHAILLDDLGLGSLERITLLQRLEERFGVMLTVDAVMLADTVQDIYQLLESACKAQSVAQQTPLPDLSQMPQHPSQPLDACHDIIAILRQHAEDEPQRLHACLLQDSGKSIELTYADLWQRVQHVAAQLLAHNIPAESVVAIALMSAEAFMVSYLAVICAGLQPLVMRMPVNVHGLRRLYWKIRLPLLQRHAVTVLLSEDRQQQLLAESINLTSGHAISHLNYTDLSQMPAISNVTFPEVNLQHSIYRRLSWDAEKLWRHNISHGQWLQQLREDAGAMQLKPTDVVLSWLPLVEPIGLLTSWLGSLCHGLPFIWMPPQEFLAHPQRWLWAIHQYRASVSFAPDTAYALCLRHIKPADCVGLDLSCWRLALNLGTVHSIEVRQRFIERFKAYQFSVDALQQAYVPAGASMLLTLSQVSNPPQLERISAAELRNQDVAQLLSVDHIHDSVLLAAGSAIAGDTLRVVNAEGELLAQRQIGFIQYQRTLDGSTPVWQQTADLGYLVQDTLYIVVADPTQVDIYGNYMSQHAIQFLTQTIPGLRQAKVLSFCVEDPYTSRNKWILILEAAHAKRRFFERRARSLLLHRMAQCFGVLPDHVLFYPKDGLQQFAGQSCAPIQVAQAYYQQGKLLPGYAGGYRRRLWQKLKTNLGRCMYPLVIAAKAIYSLYFLICCVVLLIPTRLVVKLLPRNAGRRVFKVFCQVLWKVVGCPIRCEGFQHLPASTPVIFAVNHASYLDVLALFAVLPTHASFVGKRALDGMPLLGGLFKNLGLLFVDPNNFQRAEHNLQQMVESLKQQSLVVFPEGTFTPATGLRPFKLGAFIAAAKAQVPICPVSCRGLRTILRDCDVLLRPAVIYIKAKPLLKPRGSDMQAIVDLRDRVRAAIAEDCGEPVLELIAAGPPSVTENEEG